MKQVLFIVFFFSGLSLQARIGLVYKISVASSHCIKVEMEWQSEGNRESLLQFTPLQGQDGNLTWFRGFEIESGRTVVVFNSDSTVASLLHDTRSTIKCSYLVPYLQNAGARFASQPIIQPEYFHAIGYYLFASLAGYHQQTVQLDWSALPRSWEVFNSYQQGQRTHTVSVKDKYWQEALFAAGVSETHETQLKTGRIRSYFLGKEIQQVRPELERNVIEACVQQRKFWHEETAMTEPFVAVFLPMCQPNLEMTGIGLRNAFSVFVQPEQSINPEKLRHLVYHEMMHHWIGQELRMTDPNRAVQMSDQSWFIEGFTEYFAYLTEIQSGELSISDFCDVANREFICPHYSQQHIVKRVRNEGVVVGYMAETLSEKYPYHLGFVYACYLDAQLSQNSHKNVTLQNLVELLMERAENQDGSKTEMLFVNLLYNHLGKDFLETHHSITQQGALIPTKSWPDSHPLWRMTVDGTSGIPRFWPRVTEAEAKPTKTELKPLKSGVKQKSPASSRL
jgi:predicted metalloprotease with PDZ domain